MKKTKFYLDARAHPSCLLSGNEREQVLAVAVTVSTEATQCGKVIRNRLDRLAWDAVKAAAAQLSFAGCPRPVGGMGIGYAYQLTATGEKIRV